MDADTKNRDSHKALNCLKVLVNPPFPKPPETTVKELGLPKKEYYTTADLCEVLNIKPDTFRYRIRIGKYPARNKEPDFQYSLASFS